MAKSKVISIWIWNEKNRKLFDPSKAKLKQIKVKATFERNIQRKFNSMIEVSYKHPILNKKVKTEIPLYRWI